MWKHEDERERERGAQKDEHEPFCRCPPVPPDAWAALVPTPRRSGSRRSASVMPPVSSSVQHRDSLALIGPGSQEDLLNELCLHIQQTPHPAATIKQRLGSRRMVFRTLECLKQGENNVADAIQ